MSSRPFRLPTSFKEKVWGSTRLSPWYPDSGKEIGEVWFEAELPLLVKLIFTTGNLSVQVHPGDEFAAENENSLGKTEMWHILRADEGAKIAIGLREPVTPERLHAAALSGEIEQLLRWVEVHPGETYFTPAGTVHAIGAGIALCEIQQRSDVTYRLYDYGRPRELHLDKAMKVCHTGSHDGEPVPLPIDCPYFYTDLQAHDKAVEYEPGPHDFELLIFLEGQGRIDGQPYRLGETWQVPSGAAPFRIEPGGPTRILRTWVP